MEKKQYFVMEYKELDELVSSTYGKDYQVVAEEELNNDTSITVTAKREQLEEWQMNSLKEWISGKKYKAPTVYTLFTDMANNSVLQEGDYLIYVCW